MMKNDQMEESRPLLFASVSPSTPAFPVEASRRAEVKSVHDRFFGKFIGTDDSDRARLAFYEPKYKKLGWRVAIVVALGLLSVVGLTFYMNRKLLKAAFGGATAAGPPTIVFFLIDDMGFNDIATNPATGIPLASPAMTKAARGGVILDAYYSYSECTPSRSSRAT